MIGLISNSDVHDIIHTYCTEATNLGADIIL